MKLSDLRAWIFELIAVVIPGAFAFIILIGATTNPPTLDPQILVARIGPFCFPFKQQWATAGYFLSVYLHDRTHASAAFGLRGRGLRTSQS